MARRRRRKKKRLLIHLVIATFLLAAGFTAAFMFRQTGKVENKFAPAQVSCSVEETFNQSEKTSIQVKNKSNIACYVRVRLVSYWVNAKEEVVGKASVMPGVSINSGWQKDAAEDIYYYTKPVEAGAVTEQNLLAQPIVLAEDTFHDETVYQVVEVFAEAVQAEPADAVKAAWGISF